MLVENHLLYSHHKKTHVLSLWEERFFSRKKEETSFRAVPRQNCELNQRANRGRRYVLIRGRPCKTEKCMLHLYRRVLLYLTWFSSRACSLWRGSWFFCESPCLSVCHHSPWHVLQSPSFKALPWTSRVISTCCFWPEFIVCPLLKADKLSVLSRTHNKA